MKLYKLTDKDGCTRNGTQWGPGVQNEARDPGKGPLCGPGWIHAYEHPLLAVLHDPIHGEFLTRQDVRLCPIHGEFLARQDARLWECETDDQEPLRDGQMKIGVRSLTTIREIPIPRITLEQRARYAIPCAKLVYSEPKWVAWVDSWLDGSDRTSAAAWAAEAWASAREARTWATAAMAAATAVEEARMVEGAARGTARVAKTWAAARAAEVANECSPEVDLISIAEEAMKEER